MSDFLFNFLVGFIAGSAAIILIALTTVFVYTVVRFVDEQFR